MKKSFMTRALAMGLSLAMAFSLSAATNVSVASAAATPAMASKQFAVRVGGAAKSYKASAATQKSFKITKATVGNTDKATVKVNSSKKSIKVTPGTVTGTTVVKVTFKNIKTAKTTAKKYRCVVKAAIEPEKPVEPEIVKATKITEAKAASAKTISVTFDGAVDTSTATAIKVTRGTTPITVTAKYADDAKSVVLTSDTSLAAGSYTVTVGSFEPVSFNVVKQTPTTMKIVNTTVANQINARVYFQVLDQYGDVMTNYTDKKLTVNAYNATKGHVIYQSDESKKDYFVLDCSTETTGNTAGYLNAIGDKVSIVAYLTDNASVSCKAELEIVRVYTDELTFGDVKLGDDKRVTVNRTYELTYTAKDTEGNVVTFDEKQVDDDPTPATIKINNYNFISSNTSAIDMTTVEVDSDGRLKFTAGGIDGTAIITAINTITGETTSTTIKVFNTAKLSALDIADASVACDAASGHKFKAAVTAYDQFGEVIDAKNVKNIYLYGGNPNYFNSITATPDGYVKLNKITSDGKYVEYEVAGSLLNLKNQKITYNFISKEMGESGYVKSTASISVDDEIEASALEIVKAPDATVERGNNVKVQFAVKDQYQDKMEYDGGNTFGGYVLEVRDTNDVLASTTVSSTNVKAVAGEKKVYELTLPSTNTVYDLRKTGTFTLRLMDGGKVIASKLFNLSVVDKIVAYSVETDDDSYKADTDVTVTVLAYSASGVNSYYNGSADVVVAVTKSAIAADTYSKTLKFENGVATFTLKAGKAWDGYQIKVTNKNAFDGTHFATGYSDVYEVIGNAAGKLAVDAASGKLRLNDAQGNSTVAWDRNSYATVKVMDEYLKEDITSKVTITSTNAGGDFNFVKNADNTVAISIKANNIIDTISGNDYDFGSKLMVTGIPGTNDNHNIILSITVGDFTWEKKVTHATGTADFHDGDAAAYLTNVTVTGSGSAIIASMDAITSIKQVSASAIARSVNGTTSAAVTSTAALNYVKAAVLAEAKALYAELYPGVFEVTDVITSQATITGLGDNDNAANTFAVKLRVQIANRPSTIANVTFNVNIMDDLTS